MTNKRSSAKEIKKPIQEEDIKLSSTHEVVLDANFGHGVICNKGAVKQSIPCTVECQARVDNPRKFKGSVFAVVEHAKHGVIAVSPEEFDFLNLPELARDENGEWVEV